MDFFCHLLTAVLVGCATLSDAALIESGVVPMLRGCEKGNVNQSWRIHNAGDGEGMGSYRIQYNGAQSASCLGVVHDRLDSRTNVTNAVLVPCTSPEAAAWSIVGFPGQYPVRPHARVVSIISIFYFLIFCEVHLNPSS